MTSRSSALKTVDLDDPDRLYTPAEVASNWLSCSKRKVYYLIKSGDLVAVLQGAGEGQKFIRHSDLQAYIKGLDQYVPRRAS